MNWSPRVTVAAVVEDRGRFLMVEETSSGRLVLNQPAGHLEPDETLLEGVCRETLEETAWHVRPQSVVGIYLWRHPVKQLTFLRIAFSASTIRHQKDRELDTGIERVLWMRREELLAQRDRLRSPLVLKTLDDYLTGRSYPLEIVADVAVDALMDRAQSI